MTKEQILEKISSAKQGDGYFYLNLKIPELASYLATIEERLEAMKHQSMYFVPCSFCNGTGKNITNTGVICLPCQGKGGVYYSSSTPTPTEVKDWEVRFEEEFGQYRYESVPKDMDVPVEKVKSFIRKLLNK